MREGVRNGAGSVRGVAIALLAAALALTASASALAQGEPPTHYPGKPQTIKGNPGDQQIGVTWDPPTDLGWQETDMYRAIAFTQDGNIPISACGTTGTPPATACTITGLQNGTKYMVRVRAMNGNPGDGYTDVDISELTGPYKPHGPKDPGTSDGPPSEAPDSVASATEPPRDITAPESAPGASPSVSEHRDGQFSARLQVVDSWDSGDLIHVAVTNTGDEVREWRIEIPISGTACRVFNALGGPVADGTVTLSNATWNGSLQQGESTSPGEEGVTLIVARDGYDC